MMSSNTLQKLSSLRKKKEFRNSFFAQRTKEEKFYQTFDILDHSFIFTRDMKIESLVILQSMRADILNKSCHVY